MVEMFLCFYKTLSLLLLFRLKDLCIHFAENKKWLTEGALMNNESKNAGEKSD